MLTVIQYPLSGALHSSIHLKQIHAHLNTHWNTMPNFLGGRMECCHRKDSSEWVQADNVHLQPVFHFCQIHEKGNVSCF